MKKILFLMIFTTVLCGYLSAMEIGAGYNNGAPTVKAWWNESFASELSLSFNFENSWYDSGVDLSVAYTAAPVIWSFLKNDYGSLSLSLKLTEALYFTEGRLTENNFNILLCLPEMEIKVPYLEGLRLIGRIGLSFSWNSDAATGAINGYNLAFSGLSLANFGIIYYFNSPAPAEQAQPAAQEHKGVTTTAK